jgi:hypothetical protein
MLGGRAQASAHHGRDGAGTPGNPIKSGIKSPVTDDRGIAWAIAVNRGRIRAPRHVLNAVFKNVPLVT